MLIRIAAALLCLCVSLSAQNSAQELIDAGHYRRAMHVVGTRLHAGQPDAESLNHMATLQQLAGDLPAAQVFADRAIAAAGQAPAKDAARYHLRLAEIIGEVAQHAGVLRQVTLGTRFKKEIDLALSLDPNLVGALRDEIAFYLHAPGIAGGDKGKAYAAADRIMKIDPVEGYFARVTLAVEDKREGETEGLLRKAADVQPASYDAQIRLAYFCVNNKKPEEAERHGRDAIRMHPDRIGGYDVLAMALVRQGKWPELETTLGEAEKAVYDNLLPYYHAASTCLALKIELPRAEQYLRKYLTQEPEIKAPTLADAHWRLGQVLEPLGRKNEAISEFRTALHMDPNSRAAQDLKRLH